MFCAICERPTKQAITTRFSEPIADGFFDTVGDVHTNFGPKFSVCLKHILAVHVESGRFSNELRVTPIGLTRKDGCYNSRGSDGSYVRTPLDPQLKFQFASSRPQAR